VVKKNKKRVRAARAEVDVHRLGDMVHVLSAVPPADLSWAMAAIALDGLAAKARYLRRYSCTCVHRPEADIALADSTISRGRSRIYFIHSYARSIEAIRRDFVGICLIWVPVKPTLARYFEAHSTVAAEHIRALHCAGGGAPAPEKSPGRRAKAILVAKALIFSFQASRWRPARPQAGA